MTTNIRTLSQLPQISSLSEQCLFYTSEPLSVSQDSIRMYASKSVSYEDLHNALAESILDDFKNTRGLRDSFRFDTVEDLADSFISGGNSAYGDSLHPYRGEHWFLELPNSLETLTNFTDAANNKFVNVETMKHYVSFNNSLYLGGNVDFATSCYNVETGGNITRSGIAAAPAVEDEKHNWYLFRVTNRKSNEWVAPKSGLFTCYGWVDEETTGAPDNSTRWVALEGKFMIEGKETWKILQLQPFIPNTYCSYVGFTVPVQSGMTLRIETGFKVGSNSNKYQSTYGSLTNHIANAFIGGIYTNQSIQTQNITSQIVVDNLRAIKQLDFNANSNQVRDKIIEIIDAFNK